MKNIFLSISFFTLLMLHSFGQNKSNKVDLSWGPKLDVHRFTKMQEIVGYDNTGIYVLKINKKGLYLLEHYDNKMSLSKSVELELIEEKKERNLEFIVHINNNMYVFSSFKNQKLHRNFLFVQSINKQTLLPNNDLKKVAEIDYSGHTKFNTGEYMYEISKDSSKFLIYYTLPYDKGESERFGFHVFDNSMNQIWEKAITLPYKEEWFHVEDYEVDKNGNVHLVSRIYKEKRSREEKKSGTPNYKYQILSYINKGNELKEYPVNVEGKFINDMQIAINDKQDIICGGFYSSQGTYTIDGNFFLKIDGQTKQIISKEFKEFSLDFITQTMSDKQEQKAKDMEAEGKNIELYEYDLNDIILKDDGGAILIGEQYYTSTFSYTTTNANGNSTTTTKTYYYYNDIIVINMSSGGKTEWTKKISKSQKTVDDQGYHSSYALGKSNNKLYFIFNDNTENLKNKEGVTTHYFTKNSNESAIVMVTLDSNGNQTKEALYYLKDRDDVLIGPKFCKQISKNELILFGRNTGRGIHQFAKVTIK